VHPSHRAAIAYVLGSQSWGKGLATKATELMVTELVAAYGVTQLSAVLKRSNQRSRRLLERLGFAPASGAQHQLLDVEADELLMRREAVAGA
jgi:RimJ/RimL family protein N-acetyltransferase